MAPQSLLVGIAEQVGGPGIKPLDQQVEDEARRIGVVPPEGGHEQHLVGVVVQVAAPGHESAPQDGPLLEQGDEGGVGRRWGAGLRVVMAR